MLLWREQRSLRSVEILDPHQLPHVLPGIAEETAPSRFVLDDILRWRGQAFLQRERQRVDRRDRLVEPQRQALDIDEGNGLQPVHVARKCAAQRHELWAVQALQLGVGKLQRSERRRDVAGKLQLLAGEQQHLLDFGQRPLVARRR